MTTITKQGCPIVAYIPVDESLRTDVHHSLTDVPIESKSEQKDDSIHGPSIALQLLLVDYRLHMYLAKWSNSDCDTTERPLEMRYFCSEPCKLVGIMKWHSSIMNSWKQETKLTILHLSHQLHDDAVNSRTYKNQSNQLDKVLVPQVPAS